jgi:long-chain acyl-CoA synthetase
MKSPNLDYYANPTEIEPGTLTSLFLETVDRFSDRPAFQRFVGPDELQDISHKQALSNVIVVVGALKQLRIARGDKVAILSENRPEWALADYGCLCAGVQDVPIYSTLLAHQVSYVINDSGARLLFVSTQEQLEKALECRKECPQLETIVVFDTVAELPESCLSWASFLELGRLRLDWGEAELRAEAAKAKPEDVATLIYTSGTTGDPKGVMLTHGNLTSNVFAARYALIVDGKERTLSFLPLSHVFQRMVDYLLFSGGCTIAYARSIKSVTADIKVVKPTIVVSVPRLYEKIYNRATDASGLKGVLVSWARRVGLAWADEKLAGRKPGPWLALRYAIADKLVFTKVRAAVGGELKYFVSGGAPLAADINRFFYSAGLLILEGYGLTETSPVTNVNTHADYRIGTVGKAVASTEIKIASDGEILVRGPQVMKGYFGKPEATAEVMEVGGWFKTGDIGEIDAEGFLKITDRKKDIIVTAGGKNIAPQPIENRLKINPYVEQVVMIGDRRKFPVVLIVPDFQVLARWAAQNGLSANDRMALLRSPKTQELLKDELLGTLSDLASFEKPKKIGLLHEEFTIENGILTPKQSIKRRVVEERYKALIDGIYESEAVDDVVFVAD